MEDSELGWTPPDKFVCDNCVEDEFLKQLIRDAASEPSCDYCGRSADEPIAAPVEVLMEPIAFAVNRSFGEPGEAGVPYDEGEYVVGSTDTGDVLMQLEFDCHESLFEDVAAAFDNEYWVPAANGHWLSSHRHEELLDLWHRLVEVVKHRSRFFFQRVAVESGLVATTINPAAVLRSVAESATDLGLFRTLGVGTRLYRVRARDAGASWAPTAKELGAPPREIARAGRMNPAGIPYLYVARDQATAIAEVAGTPPCTLVLAEFRASRELTLLDLGDLPDLPSVFDQSKSQERENLIFLQKFSSELSRPVAKDGREHLEYAPTQVVCEFFAQGHEAEGARRVDGIIYNSAVLPGGRNIVLFPNHDDGEAPFECVTYVDAETMTLETWPDLSKRTSP